MSRPHIRVVASPSGAEQRPLRIGMIAPPWFEVPPSGYGGTEAVVAGIVDGLIALGHEVTLIGAGRRLTHATQFVAAFEKPPFEELGSSSLPEVVLAARAARVFAELELDIVHDHSLAGPLLSFGRDTPTVTTVHGPVTASTAEYYSAFGRTLHLVAISRSQRSTGPGLNWAGTVHNAIDVASFPIGGPKTDALLWIGRFTPEKGAHFAIDAADATGRPLVLAGKLNEQPEREYFEQMVRPRLRSDVEFVGEADAELKRVLFARSAALLFPIQWEEPFGMVMIESLACGTPVVAFRRGSVPEVIDHGITGMIIDDPSELPSAVQRACELDPEDCRVSAEKRFDLSVMVRGYEQVYRRVIATHRDGWTDGTQAKRYAREGASSALPEESQMVQ